MSEVISSTLINAGNFFSAFKRDIAAVGFLEIIFSLIRNLKNVFRLDIFRLMLARERFFSLRNERYERKTSLSTSSMEKCF